MRVPAFGPVRLSRSLQAAAVIGLGASLAACGSGSAAADGGGGATTAPASSATAPAVSVSAAPPVTPFPTSTTPPHPDRTLLAYSESGGLTGMTTTIQITAGGKLTLMKAMGNEPSQVTRRLTPAQLSGLKKLVASTPLRGTCKHVIHPEAIIVTLAASGHQINCVDLLPAALRPLQSTVKRLAR
jgi:hypothetical protein